MIFLVTGAGVGAVLLAGIGAWLAVEGPSPGLSLAVLVAPFCAGSMAVAVGAIRLAEADNSTGVRYEERLAHGWWLVDLGLYGAAAALVLVAVLLGVAWWRAKRAEVPGTHGLTAVVWVLGTLLYGRLALAATRLALGWSGPETLADPAVAGEVMVLLALGGLGLGGAVLLALGSLLAGLALRFWRRPTA